MRSGVFLVIASLIGGCATQYQDAADMLLETDWVASNIAFVPVWEGQSTSGNESGSDLDSCISDLQQMKFGFASVKDIQKVSANTKKLQILNCMAIRGWQLVPNEVVVTK